MFEYLRILRLVTSRIWKFLTLDMDNLCCRIKYILQTKVDYPYLEVRGTLWNTSWYPYPDISDLQNWRQNKSSSHISQLTCNLTPDIRDILKILWKRGEIAPEERFLLFSTISCYLLFDFFVKTGTKYNSKLFEIIKVEITKVICIWTYKM